MSLSSPSYVEFEPYCEWKREKDVDTLILHLPDFKKEQLKVQVINNQRILKVSGDRPMDRAQRKRFLKETKLPEDCNIDDIKAKFIKGHLHVIMPKRPQVAPRDHEPKLEDTQKPKAETPQLPDDQGLKAPSSTDDYQEDKMERRMGGEDQPKDDHKLGRGSSLAQSSGDKEGKMGRMGGDDQPKDDHMLGLSSSLTRLQQGKKMAVYFGVVVAVMVAVGAFLAHKSGSEISSSLEDLGLN